MYKNMKIAINEQQPLDEVVAELERGGYVRAGVWITNEKWIITSKAGLYIGVNKLTGFKGFKLTTLAELKEQLNAAD